MTPAQVLRLKAFEDRMPELPPRYRDRILATRVLLDIANIPEDSEREYSILESFLLESAWWLAYVLYAESSYGSQDPFEHWREQERKKLEG